MRRVGILYNHSDVEYEFVDEETGVRLSYKPWELPEGIQYNYRIWLDLDTEEWGRMDEVAAAEMKEPKHVLLLMTTGSIPTQIDINKVGAAGRELERFYKFYAGDIWDVKVHADAVHYTKAPWNNNWNAAMFNEYLDAAKDGPLGGGPWIPEGFVPNYFHCWSHYGHQSWCGLGQLYNKYSWTQASCGLHTIIHELGHNFGLHHATEGGKEYGDKSCVMGAGGIDIPGLNSPHLAKLRKDARRPFAEVNETGNVVLSQMEMSDHWLWPGESKMAEVNNAGKRVWLSLRRVAGATYDYSRVGEDKLHIHTKDSSGKTELHGFITPGDYDKKVTGYKILPNGVVAHYMEYEPDYGRAYVFLAYNGEDPVMPTEDTRAKMYGFPPGVGTDSKLEAHHSGLWYNPAMDGHGLALHADDGGLVAGGYFSFHDAEVQQSRGKLWINLNFTKAILRPLDNNNMILYLHDQFGRNAFELQRLSLPALDTRSLETDTFNLYVHQGINNPLEGTTESAILIAQKGTSNWWYAQNGIIYDVKGGRWGAESDTRIEPVGTIFLRVGAVDISIGGQEWAEDTEDL